MTARFRLIAPGLALALFATAAAAADLPARGVPAYAPPPPIPAFTWTGFYVGAQVGYEFGRSSGVFYTPTGFPGAAPGTVFDSNGGSKNGVIGGVHVGYLLSTQSLPLIGSFFGGNGAFGLGTGGVFGVEGDVDGSTARTNYVFPNTGLVSSARETIQGSLRGRLGVAVNRALFYATGGVALGSLRNTYSIPGVGLGVDSYNPSRVGYTVGGGVEYSFTNNLSARVEYRYTDFGTYTNLLTANSLGAGVPPGTFAVQQRETDNRVQAGVSYKFEAIAPAPVVARY